MSISRRIILVTSSVFLLLFIALSLAATIEVRQPPSNVIQINVAQAATLGDAEDLVGAEALLNGTDLDTSSRHHVTSTIPGATRVPTAMTETQEGIIGLTPLPKTSPAWSAEGVLGGPIPTPTPCIAIPVPAPQPPPSSAQIPIVALTYTGSGGPKHCRGQLLQKTYFPPPMDQWKEGTCINLPSEARCGVFFSNPGDNCEAQLFSTSDCRNTSVAYVNTVVFMPEERAVGALWNSMWVRCGVDVPETKMLDPGILGGALKRPGKGG
ncbi:hypothetical protein BDW02DRAFT_408660 [Decorospora gaudefroyi]|uniref:Uncharacterized protein n=1 Tax=Decorospora gaudefroyi TaxID=184978 RepID=A0A6A5K965_9PLEO|nr:hypothetical protein BDW02DRAFT_408660 [Decorospora gaudefroyi]